MEYFSVLKDESKRISKNCIWLLSVGLIIMISLTALFSGYFVLSFNQKNNANSLFSSCKSNQTILSNKYESLSKQRSDLMLQNQNLVQNVSAANSKNTELIAKLQKLNFDFENAKKNLLNTEILLGTSSTISLVTILANIYFVPYLFSGPQKTEKVKNEFNYLEPKYAELLNETLKNYMIQKELNFDKKLKLLYSTNNFSIKNTEFIQKVTNHKQIIIIISNNFTGDNIGFVLTKQFILNENNEIFDSDAFTFSFKNMLKTQKLDNNIPAFKNKEFLQIGNQEILIYENGTAKASLNNGFSNENYQGNPKDFYVKNGNFNINSINVFELE